MDDLSPRWVRDESSSPETVIQHLDGVAHSAAPLPGRWHRCRVQSRGFMGFRMVERCPCGAIRVGGRRWMERNSRRRYERKKRRA